MRKNTFSQKLGLNTFFGKKVKTEWVTGIEIDEQREAEIQFYFSNKVEFHLATPPDELVSLLEKFKLRTRDITNNKNNSVFGEKIPMVWLIVMDNFSGIADNCKKFSGFSTVCRKYRYHWIYVFHREWVTGIEIDEQREAEIQSCFSRILPQTNIFNIFPSSVLHNIVAKILQSYTGQATTKICPCSFYVAQ